MATGVPPRDEDVRFSKVDLETIQDALKQKKFRDLLAEYCQEIRDPANQALYQKEMVQLEKERGYDVTFINPKGGYVIKTSVAGDRKAFINICSNENVGKPSCNVEVIDGRKGMNWQIPYSLTPPREDYDQKHVKCVIYDVVFHTDTLRMANQNKQFRELVNKTAMNALIKTYDINLDENNFRFPKSEYKGMSVPAVIRKEDPNYVPPSDEENENLPPELIEKMYPQRSYQAQDNETNIKQKPPQKQEPIKKPPSIPKKTQNMTDVTELKLSAKKPSEKGYTVPKYVIKQQKNVDLQEYTYNKDCKEYTAIPNQLVIEIYLPLLSSTKDCSLDVQEKSLKLISEKPAKYKLEIDLPYSVNDLCGSAKFDKTRHKLIVSLPVVKKLQENCNLSLKVDSGVDSEDCASEDDGKSRKLVTEISSIPALETKAVHTELKECHQELFLDPTLGYVLPTYTHNVLDNTIAFTFHVKNTEPDSVKVQKMDQKVYIKFTSIGSSYVPIYYAALIIFDDEVEFEDISGEAWDNNVILQMTLCKGTPLTFKIGLDENSVVSEKFEATVKPVESKNEVVKSNGKILSENLPPVVEVLNLGSETNIMVSSNNIDEDDDDFEEAADEKEIVWVETNNDNEAKSILRKPLSSTHSLSESSVGDVASSMDYMSSDCVPEESSYKKTVRFNDVIAKQVYRYNSSIEGQKKKNQRKKIKKRNLELRKSESEAEDDVSEKVSKPKLSSALKQRHDSGLADTSDADTDSKNTPTDSKPFTFNKETSVLGIVNSDKQGKPTEPVIWESEKEAESDKPGDEKLNNKDAKETPITCDNIKHNTNLYNPDNLYKGRYLEVQFKNDLIFDLDM